MRWTQNHDICLLREMLLFEPWNCKHGSKERGQCWDRISEALNQIEKPKFKVTQRAVQDRYSVLEKAFKSKRNEEEKSSSISPKEKEVDVAIGDILERFEESRKQQKKENEKKKKNQDNEIAKAEEMRKKSLETISETKKRNDLVGDETPAKKQNTRSEALKLIREKNEADRWRRDGVAKRGSRT